ncbi:MAG TPA: TIM barrel protein [Acidimicrobiales bacterium]
MKIALGVDTLSYHCRISTSEVTVEEVFSEIASLGAAYVHLDLHHVRERSLDELAELRKLADDLGLRILTSGDFVGTPRHGDTTSDGVARIGHWMEQAVAVGSPIIRVASSFYRAELAGQPELIAAEQRYVIDTLTEAAEKLSEANVQVLLENHSDFTAEEYGEIVEQVGPERMGVFLDLINPIATLADPVPVAKSLARFAPAGHVKDYRFESHYVEDGYHRRSFEVQWCYPGEGVADLPSLLGVLVAQPGERTYGLAIEGLDNWPGVADQRLRLDQSLELLRTLIGSSLATTADW